MHGTPTLDLMIIHRDTKNIISKIEDLISNHFAVSFTIAALLPTVPTGKVTTPNNNRSRRFQ